MAEFRIPGTKKRAREAAEEAAAAPMTALEDRREELRERFAQLQWDLGGAAYEMAARDYFRLDVLARIAARLQLVDAELAEIERMARLERAGASGSCPGCGSLHAQGAIYCWRCGRNLHETSQAVVSAHLTNLGPEVANGTARFDDAEGGNPGSGDVFVGDIGGDPGLTADQYLDQSLPGPSGGAGLSTAGDAGVDFHPGPGVHRDPTPPPSIGADGVDPGFGNHPNIDPGSPPEPGTGGS